MLLEAGADKDLARTSDGHTPLHMACHFGMVEMMRFLIGVGANEHAVAGIAVRDPKFTYSRQNCLSYRAVSPYHDSLVDVLGSFNNTAGSVRWSHSFVHCLRVWRD